MANSNLQGKVVKIPYDILEHLRNIHKHSKSTLVGYERLDNLVNDGTITYEKLKRLKNFFDHINIEKEFETYRVSGGDKMKNWVNKTLENLRDADKNTKTHRKDIGELNKFKKEFNKGTKTLDRDYLVGKIKI